MKLSLLFLSLAIFLTVSYIFPVECQYVSKTTYFTNVNCTGDIYATVYLSSTSKCTFPTPATTCKSVSTYAGASYYTSECAQEIPTNVTLNFMSSFIYSNSSCTGAVKSVTIIPMNVCIKEVGVTYYGITDMTTKTYYSDSKCASKLFPISLNTGSCLPGSVMYTTAGTIPSPTPTTLQQYEKVLFYNGTVQGASTCSSGVIGQVYRPVSSCISANCQQVDNSKNNFQKKECTTSLPTSATAGTFQIATYIDQTSCSSSQTV